MMHRITVLTGEKGSGKTTLCQRILEGALQRGLDAAGVLSPARFDGDVKIGIDVLEVRTGERRALAEADDHPGVLRTHRYRFDPESVLWGAECLAAACPCDVLIVDEIGPLEVERGQGWANALDILRAGRYGLAVVVVRPGLLDAFCTSVAQPRIDTLTLPAAAQHAALIDALLAPWTPPFGAWASSR
ncbi:MAG: hypothetical protein IT323_00485 [Anaerolineae bacterium]|nr:hypothetical protein [Anaerolineae bacterium]